MDTENIFYIQSHYLKLVEPLMQQYYDYESSMLFDEIQKDKKDTLLKFATIEEDEKTKLKPRISMSYTVNVLCYKSKKILACFFIRLLFYSKCTMSYICIFLKFYTL